MKKYFSGGYYHVFFIRILFIFLLFTFTRALFYFLNYPFFRDIDFITVIKIFFFGLRFDLAAIIITYSPFIIFSILPFHFKSAKFYQVILLIFFSLSTAITQAANLLDCAYFHYTLSRTTSNIFNTIGLGTDFTTLLPQYVKDFWYLFLIWICIIIMSILFFIKTKITKPLVLNKSFIFYVKDFFVFVLISIFSFIGARGGVQLRPINIITAGKYASSKNTAIVLNTPFTIIKTIGKSEIKYNPYYKEEELTNIYSPVKYYYNKAKEFNSKNVVLIILESFSKEYIGALNKNMENGNYKGYTPFLDSLINKSIVFPNMYANTKRSVEAIPAILVGIPALMNDSYISSKYSGNTINSIAGLLKTKGYSSAFYHGGTNGTMGFDNFVKMAGFDRYYGRTEYNNDKDYDGKWGIFDDKFLQFTAVQLTKMKQPFVAAVYTLSSHHPYIIPDNMKGLFPKGELAIHQSIAYTDYSLKQFFKKVSKEKWFDNTLFVITADHASESVFPYYQTRSGIYSIPLIFYQKNNINPCKNNTLAQQTAILPSILDYLNFDHPFVSFGESVFDTTHSHYAINYMDHTYQLIQDGYAYTFDGNMGISLYNLTNDSLMKNNILEKSTNIAKDLDRRIKAIIQSYNLRMIQNKLVVK